jgi:hypothetical protein
MEPPLGQISFFLLCMQYARAQLENLGAKPYTAAYKSRRSIRLCKVNNQIRTYCNCFILAVLPLYYNFPPLLTVILYWEPLLQFIKIISIFFIFYRRLSPNMIKKSSYLSLKEIALLWHPKNLIKRFILTTCAFTVVSLWLNFMYKIQ